MAARSWWIGIARVTAVTALALATQGGSCSSSGGGGYDSGSGGGGYSSGGGYNGGYSSGGGGGGYYDDRTYHDNHDYHDEVVYGKGIREHVPRDTDLADENIGKVSWTATEAGTIYVTDSKNNDVIFRRDVRRGDTYSLDAEKDRMFFNGREASRAKLDNSRRYRIFFERAPRRRY